MRIDFQKVTDFVLRTGPILRSRIGSGDVTVKGRADFVTATDLAVQELLRNELGSLYPDVSMMAEEKDNREIDPSASFWILDPVDGTTNLIHDYRQSAVSLAYVEDGVLTAGIIYQPYTEELFTAVRGHGAFLNGAPMRIHPADSLENCLISFGTAPYRKEMASVTFDTAMRIFRDAADVRRSGSAALDIAYVAAGRTDGFFEFSLYPWDYAAGKLMVEEAGGVLTDFAGGSPEWRRCPIVAGSPTVARILREKYLT